MGKIKVLVVPSDNIGGVGFYRSTQPHVYLAEKYPEEFDVTINMKPNFKDLQSFDKYDIVHIHKGLFDDMNSFYAFLAYAKEHNITTIMDIDDYWDLGMHHPQSASQRIY